MDSPHIVVSIVTKPRAGRSEVRIPAGARDFLSSKTPRLAVRPMHLPIQCVLSFFPVGKKRPGSKINHSPSPSVEVTNDCGYPSVSFICSHSVETDNFTVLLTMCGLRTQTHKRILCNRMNVKIRRKNAKS